MDVVIQEPEVSASGSRKTPIMVDVTADCVKQLPLARFYYSRPHGGESSRKTRWVRMTCCDDPKKAKRGHNREITFEYRNSSGGIREHLKASGFKVWAELLGLTPQALHDLILRREPQELKPWK